MKKLPRTLLSLFVIAGLNLGILPSSGAAQAADSKRKPVAAKKTVKAAKVVKSVQPAARKKVSVQKVSVQKVSARRAVSRVAAVSAVDSDGITPKLASSAVTIIDQTTGDVLYEKNAAQVAPIASITKLMTAMVALDAQPSLDEILTISEADYDTLKGTHSRLAAGTQLTREEMLRLALMSSENRAASALSRHYPGGRPAFIAAMNQKALEIGMSSDAHFSDPTGLTPENVASARDLAKMVDAAHQYPLIREFSTSEEYQVAVRGRAQTFRNTNALVRNEHWSIGLSKTGYISEAGKCLVMQAWFNNKPTIIVLLDSWGKLTRIGDAQRIKRWIESVASMHPAVRG
jgi:D-alanyl-D-alanine endopeptidase (penicillin-binding protein 7)